MEERNAISLFELQNLVRSALEEQFPDKFWVRAEVSSVQVKTGGHCYLELSESDGSGVLVAKARAVIWRSRYVPLIRYFKDATGSEIQAGMEIFVRASVSFSELYGLSLVIDEIEPAMTLGASELERRKTIARLTEEGMMDRQRSLPEPVLPYRLAVISARDAAGFGDFCRHLEENPYGFRFKVDLFESAMQGENAPSGIADALEAVEAAGNYDAALILRGGGSVLDLACFDDYGLCLAIASCSVPVYTAVGHQRDNHIADMVAFASVKTPTALADSFVDALCAEDERIGAFAVRLRLALRSKIADMESRIDLLESRISSADPRRVMSRGYSLVADERGVVVKTAAALSEGDRISLYFSDGTITATVDGKI